MTLGHEKLDVYQLSLEYVAWVYQECDKLNGVHRPARDQWLRASQSIPLNIAEGNGKTTEADRRRYFEIARGSVLECAAIQDVLVVGSALSEEESRVRKNTLDRMVAMLSKLGGRGYRVREDTPVYPYDCVDTDTDSDTESHASHGDWVSPTLLRFSELKNQPSLVQSMCDKANRGSIQAIPKSVKHTMKTSSLIFAGFLLLGGALHTAWAEEPLSEASMRAALHKAATFFHKKVAVQGGYVYYYSVDLSQRWGRGPCRTQPNLGTAAGYAHRGHGLSGGVQSNRRSLHEALRFGLDALLAAQFANGGFPQGWKTPVSVQPVLQASCPDYDWRSEGRIKNYQGERLVGQPKFAPGQRYIASAVFSHHVSRLSEYLAILSKRR